MKEKPKPYEDHEITIRGMVEADLFFLKQMLNDPVVLGYFPMSNAQEVEDASKTWQNYARQKAAFTIEVNGVPAGMANLYINMFEKLRYQSLFAIVVGEKFRGRGVGTRLLKFLIKEAKETFGLRLLHLEVYKGNPAYNLYKRLGFQEYGIHKRFMKLADGSYQAKILMQLDLTK